MCNFNSNPCSRKGKLIWTITVTLVVLSLAVGLGVGLTKDSDSNKDQNSASTSATGPGDNNRTASGTWKANVGATWNYEINGPLNQTPVGTFAVWDIDLFENDKATINSLQSRGAAVICYFSAGSFEDWRPDANSFNASDLGDDLNGWPGEKWLNTSSQNVRDIMLKRLDLAAARSCDGVDPDNVDAYNNDNGLDLTQTDAIDYMTFLADAAHGRNLSIGLKNAAEIISNVAGKVDYSVNESCVEYNECQLFAAFIDQGKPVFHVEYPKGRDVNNSLPVSASARAKACAADGQKNFSTIIKNANLDSWIELC